MKSFINTKSRRSNNAIQIETTTVYCVYKYAIALQTIQIEKCQEKLASMSLLWSNVGITFSNCMCTFAFTLPNECELFTVLWFLVYARKSWTLDRKRFSLGKLTHSMSTRELSISAESIKGNVTLCLLKLAKSSWVYRFC